jgi:hypothetical protein
MVLSAGMRVVYVAAVMLVADVIPGGGCGGPRACTRDRSGQAAVLVEDTYVQREPGQTSHDFPLAKGTEVRTHDVQQGWVFIHRDADLPGGGTQYLQGWVPRTAIAAP